ncbi:biotin transporter BioY [Leucobacter triazinivorans]|uniref:Biotin transporter n=1 Tax=Leucobacter triazinivorans TaxID=1784719 RepID=A0A4P6KFU1_9MICO|nr:biotin transporter BioY [Leucobacter triazinivorans]QBE48828.1 biotin transporter BioY [Leucobacter triazinivorans]
MSNPETAADENHADQRTGAPAAEATAAPASTAAPSPASARPKRTNAATDLALIATFAAFIAVCAILPAITIAGPVPFTLQTFAILLTGAVLGARRGFLAAALYLAIGAIGLPVFAGGAAGLAPFAGPTVGYLLSFPLAAAATGAIVSRIPRRGVTLGALLIFLAALVGVVVNHGLGILGLVWRADMTFGQAALADLVFLPGDVVKALLAAVIAAAVHRAFPALLPRRSRG